MRIVIPACLLGLVLLSGAGLAGCQQDRAARPSPSMGGDAASSDQAGDATRLESSRSGTIQSDSQSGTIRNDQESGYTSPPG